MRSDQASSGVIFSIDTETGFEKTVFVTASWGLGENIVQGHVNPDEARLEGKKEGKKKKQRKKKGKKGKSKGRKEEDKMRRKQPAKKEDK